MATPAGRPELPAAVEAAFELIDRSNHEDPNIESVAASATEPTAPREWIRGREAHAWLLRLDPKADAAQQLAARAHHFRRWTRPRDAYPTGRVGYLRWRRDAKEAHAAEVATLLSGCGVDQSTVERCRGLIEKSGNDEASRSHEDALCLVFFERDARRMVAELGERAEAVVTRTLAKMSDEGHRALLERADLHPEVRHLVQRLLR